jgi:metallo-beta-lactamase family protein
MPNTISFLGAARTVTGSRHLLDLDGTRVLVDCGLFQGSAELRDRNWQPFPVEPHTIDAVVITHAHTDHIGYLPRLVADGFRGPIYATPGTIGLCKVSLPDSGRLQEEDARYHARHQSSRHPEPQPLYTEADAYNCLKRFRPVPYRHTQTLPGHAQFQFLPAGHILGAGFAEITLADGQVVLMGGDLGRWDRPIIQDPTMVASADYLVVESTYGDRVHPTSDPKEQLAEICERALRDRSVIVVPSFAIGRTQEMLWFLHQLRDEGRFPGFPIYVDSPMASAATLLYTNSAEDHDEEMKVDLARGHSPLQDMVKFVRDRNMSKSLNAANGPFMVIAGSGMMNGGRVLHHLLAHGGDPSTILLFTGYQAEGTLGRRLQDGDTEVRILGHEFNVRAHVESMDSLSAHADSNEIMRWLHGFERAPKQTFIVHGEPPAQEALAQRIEQELGWSTMIPEWEQTVTL